LRAFFEQRSLATLGILVRTYLMLTLMICAPVTT
jgi:hypothetical protein